jgi:hypothetical protein
VSDRSEHPPNEETEVYWRQDDHRTPVPPPRIDLTPTSEQSYIDALREAVRIERRARYEAEERLAVAAQRLIDLDTANAARDRCPFRSSVTDLQCNLPDGHPQFSFSRFHDFRIIDQAVELREALYAIYSGVLGYLNPDNPDILRAGRLLYPERGSVTDG